MNIDMSRFSRKMIFVVESPKKITVVREIYTNLCVFFTNRQLQFKKGAQFIVFENERQNCCFFKSR